ncbi:MAG: DUF3489 domain-containing protein [Bryobacteraceae bacterium]|jgi:hypothetical protein
MTNTEAATVEHAAAVAQQSATVVPEKAPSKKGASQNKAAPKGQKNAKGKPPAAKPKREPKAHKNAAKPAQAKRTARPRADSKGSKILALIGRPKGATLAEIMEATKWQAHSVRGFLSTVSKKRGLKIESTRTEAGERTYRIAK